ncbi:hypothetical protein [Streptomyces sp. NPDC059909]|uniref:hypothetical protein n=1 Tax=Streptomyces sp. NPDC059909 TaxID=3346998 RepID=UPI0036604DB6
MRLDTEEYTYSVEFMCGRLGVSRSGCYDWRSRPESATAQRRDELKLLITKRTYTCTACGAVSPRDKSSARVMLVGAGLNPASQERLCRRALADAASESAADGP